MAMTAKMQDILESRQAPGTLVRRSIEAFESPVDKSVITNSRDLREHNARNGVIDAREWGNDQFCDLDAKKRREEFYLGNSPHHRDDRKRDINEAIRKCEQGYRPEVKGEDNAE